jgi:glyoxylase-like metal-dependent hydrolase (beta-lactamase superfamily II)
VQDACREHGLLPAAVLLTHGHIDHVWSVAPVAHGYGIAAYIHDDDRYRLADPAGTSIVASREHLLAMTKGELELTEPDDVRPLADGGVLDLAGITLVVSHAPGHTEGSVTFTRPAEGEDPPIMWSGDVLFAGSIGRTDLPGGDHGAMLRSLERVIVSADDATIVLPGHGPSTTVGAERASNPYLRFAGDTSAPRPRGL